MSTKRIVILSCILAIVAVTAIGAWIAGSRIMSPAEAASRTAPPTPSPILVPIEERVLSSNIVTRGTARFGLPQPISIAPSALKTGQGIITTLPMRSAQLKEGGVLLTASGRPVFILQGDVPAYRDLVPGNAGNDVRQLEQAIARLGFDPGPIDGTYDQQTSEAVAQWYKSAGWEPFGPTAEQLLQIRTLEDGLADATKNKQATAGALASAGLALDAARAKAEHANRVAAAELAVKTLDRKRLLSNSESSPSRALEAVRAKAMYANQAATADIAAKIADRALIVLDPRSTRTSRAAADAQLELARASALNTQLEGELAVQAAERDSQLAAGQLDLAQAAMKAAQLEGELAVQVALQTQTTTELDAKVAQEKAARLAADLGRAKAKLGVQVPLDEIVFVPALPVRVEEVTRRVGEVVSGPVMAVTDYKLVIDSSLPVHIASLVKPGMPVAIDDQALGIHAEGTVDKVATTPGTNGVDGYHIYCEVRVLQTSTPLDGFSLRLTIPVQSTKGVVTAVPISAISLAADGTSRLQVETNGAIEFVTVKPGLSADGFVEVTPVNGALAKGQLVVVGNENHEKLPQK